LASLLRGWSGRREDVHAVSYDPRGARRDRLLDADLDPREMIGFQDVTACLVTRGDVDLDPILKTLPYEDVVIWDNSKRDDLKCFGRYAAMAEAENEVVYFQDDDVIFREHETLLSLYEPGHLVANWGHGDTPCGYDDLALVCAGALVDRELPFLAFRRYEEEFGFSEEERYEADFIAGLLTPHRHVYLSFEIRDVAYNGKRLADEPWQREAKLRVTNKARWIRDHGSGLPPTTDSMNCLEVA
jgi:hypothetical protein